MKCKRKQQSKGFLHNSNAPLITAIVVVLLSLLTMTRFTANASTTNTSNDISENKCTECKGYSKEFLFNQNTTLMKEAALNYFTDERLPQTLNNSKKLSLEQMLEEKLLYKIVDSNNNACSLTDSYVEVTKLENEYLFKINLSCSDISDYILVHKGCYNYCNGNNCPANNEEPKVEPKEEPKEEPKDENIYEYEFKKTIGCVMSDWSNWSEWTTIRQTTSNNKREEIKVEKVVESRILEKDSEIKTVYNCDKYEGYKLIGNLCVRSISNLFDQDYLLILHKDCL